VCVCVCIVKDIAQEKIMDLYYILLNKSTVFILLAMLLCDKIFLSENLK